MRYMWSQHETESLCAQRKSGATWLEIAKAMGRSPDGCRKRWCLVRDGAVVIAESEPIPEGTKEAFREASSEPRIKELERQLAELAMTRDMDRPPVTTASIQSESMEEIWRRAEIEGARAIQKFHERSLFKLDFEQFDPGMPVGVSFISDQHISPGNVIDFTRMRRDAELVAETDGLYSVLGGDGVDNHIVIRPAVIQARTQPQEQYELYDHYLGIMQRKIIAMISGNHDAWTDQVGGIDMVQMLAHKNRICYSPATARIDLLVGGQPYDLAIRHRYKFGSSFNMLHSVKRWWDMGERPFDIGVICHNHEPSVGSFERHGVERWGARPGAYQIGSSFTRDFGWCETRPTCPTFVLWPGERMITGFNDIRMAAKFLKSERGNK